MSKHQTSPANLLLPRVIALCGAPESGKSEVQRMLGGLFGYQAYDDGQPLREAAMDLYGLEPWQVYTQEGKRSQTEVMGETVQVRKLIGELGCMMETTHGENFVPWRAMKEISKRDPKERFALGSIRRNQASVIRDEGGVCLEIRRPGKKPVYEFDRYNPGLVDVVIENGVFHSDGSGEDISLDELTLRVQLAMERASKLLAERLSAAA